MERIKRMELMVTLCQEFNIKDICIFSSEKYMLHSDNISKVPFFHISIIADNVTMHVSVRNI